MLFTRPEEPELHVDREPVEGESCPECGHGDVRAYPVLSMSGWRLVARCQRCLFVLREQPSPTPFGFTYVPYSAYLRGF